MRRPLLAATLVALALSTAATSTAARAETAGDFNLFVLQDMNVPSSDVEGRVAVGGNATLQSYSVGFPHGDPNAVNLIVGGNLSATNGSTVGKMIVGGAATFTGWDSSGLLPSGTPIPVDFAAEAIRLNALSDDYAALAATGLTTFNDNSCAWRNCQTTFTSTVSGLNVFNLNGAKAADTNTFRFNLDPGAVALVNVSGSYAHIFDAGIFVNGVQVDAHNAHLAQNILWNFSDATTASFHGIAMAGSILAPDADYLGGWGVVLGQVVVKSFSGTNGSTQINYAPHTGGLIDPPTTAVPEPATWALMIGGFGLAGAMLRRRRALAA